MITACGKILASIAIASGWMALHALDTDHPVFAAVLLCAAMVFGLCTATETK